MKKIKLYLKESYDELKHKVSWPTFSELQNSAIVVSIASLIIALIVLIIDVLFGVVGSLDKTDPQAQETFWRGVLGFIYWYLT
jgi:preprotein translocase subunit SecE